MDKTHKSWKELANDLIIVAFVSGTLGIALKFTTFFDKWVYFPSFPNTLDSLFISVAVLYLASLRVRWFSKPMTNDPQRK